MFSCNNITIAYEHVILKDIGFSLYPGAIILLKGPNGSGKTSFLRGIAGLKSLKSGTMLWDDFDLRDNPTIINYIGIKNAIKPSLTVLDNIKFWAELRGYPELVFAALSYFKLMDIIDTPCNQLSSGWNKRVALARLLCSPSLLWLLDEPETHLDEEGKKLLDNLINIRARDGGIVILASHNLNLPPCQIINMADFAYE
jgi:heme exporter protein A